MQSEGLATAARALFDIASELCYSRDRKLSVAWN